MNIRSPSPTSSTKKARPEPRPAIQSASALVVRGLVESGHDIDPPAAFVESHLSIHQREQCPITACADVVACEEFGATLSNDDAASGDILAAKTLHAQPFADAVAPITNAAL